jgi:hypothetical protein
MSLIHLLAIAAGELVAGDVERLGADDWRIREAAHARLDNLVAALLLPAAAENPEVRHRLQEIRGRRLKWFAPAYVESHICRADFEAWLRLYLVPGRSAIAERWETFEHIHTDYDRASAVFREWPAIGGNEGFLRGRIYPGEFEKWLAHIDYHLGRAPAPREK